MTKLFLQEIENDDEKPVKLHDELDSFYSDIASIEASFNQTNTTEQVVVKVEETQVPKPQPEYIFLQDDSGKVEEKVVKKKKKVSQVVLIKYTRIHLIIHVFLLSR